MDVVVDVVVVLVIIPVEPEVIGTEMVETEAVVDEEIVVVAVLVDAELVVDVEIVDTVLVGVELIDVGLVNEFEAVVTIEDVVDCAVEEAEPDVESVVLELELDPGICWIELEVEESRDEPVDEEDKSVLLEVVELVDTLESVDWLDGELVVVDFVVVEIVERLVPSAVEDVDELVIGIAIFVDMVEVELDLETEDAVVTVEVDDFEELVEVFRVLEVV